MTEPEFLTEAYIEALMNQGAQGPFGNLAKDVSGTLALKVSGGPGGETKGKTNASFKLTKGKLAAASLGTTKLSTGKDPALMLEASYELAAALFANQADPVEQYMAGNLKVSGDMALWFQVLPAWQAAA